MSKIKSAFFGGASKEGGRKAREELGKGRAAIEAGAAQGREDLLSGFNLAQQSRQAGLGGALDVFSQSVPGQADVFQAGNIAAQQQLLGGLDPTLQALLGQQPDLSGLAPTTLPFDFSFTQQQLPQTQTIGQQPAPAATGQQLTPDQIRTMLQGRGR